MTSDTKIDPSRCPLCGSPNSCAVVNGATEPCWCSNITIPSETLEKIPLSARERACLCPRCAGLSQARSE